MSQPDLTSSIDSQHMRRAMEVARRAKGFAEPNPTVGCVIAVGPEILAEGWTQSFGSDHAEVHALSRVPEDRRSELANATLFVTLEPCCHHGKTPPCTDAILSTALKRVRVALEDPFPEVAGKGIQQLRDAGIDVEVGLQEQEARQLIAPYLKLQREKRPWVIAKWAMTLDGKIATSTGDSQWISGEAAREIVHQIRGRVDGVMVGIGTALADDPLLNARPVGPRVAARIVVDSRARLPLNSRLVQSANEFPVLLAVGPEANESSLDTLRSKGVEVFVCDSTNATERVQKLMDELGRRKMTNILVEGGGELLGSFWDAKLVDEVHVFVAPIVVGGAGAISPVAGEGKHKMSEAFRLADSNWSNVGNDLYLHGIVDNSKEDA